MTSQQRFTHITQPEGVTPGPGYSHVVTGSGEYYLTDMAHLPTVRIVRDEFIDTTRPPASTAVPVVALARPEFLLEVEAFALAGDGR